MNAIKVYVAASDWDKIEEFLMRVRSENIFAYRLDITSFLVVTTGEYPMSWVRQIMGQTFERDFVEMILGV